MRGTTFSKKLLIAEFAIFIVLLILTVLLLKAGYDVEVMGAITAAWLVPLGVSTGFYFWKSKAENLLKMAIQLLKDLPEDMKEKADPNQIIDAVIGIKNSD